MVLRHEMEAAPPGFSVSISRLTPRSDRYGESVHRHRATMTTENDRYQTNLQHPDPIVRARVLDDLADQHYDKYVAGSRRRDYHDWLVDRLQLRMSGMALDRYLRLLETPEAVQQAVSAGEIPKSMALRVALLKNGPKREIVTRIDAGEPTKAVVQEVLQQCSRSSLPPPGTPAAEYRKLLTTAARTLRAVDGCEEEVVGQAMPMEAAVAILEQLLAFVGRMKEAEIEAFQQDVEAIRSRMMKG